MYEADPIAQDLCLEVIESPERRSEFNVLNRVERKVFLMPAEHKEDERAQEISLIEHEKLLQEISDEIYALEKQVEGITQTRDIEDPEKKKSREAMEEKLRKLGLKVDKSFVAPESKTLISVPKDGEDIKKVESMRKQIESLKYEMILLRNSVDAARGNKSVFQRFGRFPQRNKFLGRPSTQEEIDFLLSKRLHPGFGL